MVTTDQILAVTGLKSAKTLTRWQQAGIIPAPHVGTHPSGRGKIAYYPDWVLDHCRRIAELQRQGHTLRSAVLALETDRIRTLVEAVAKPSTAALLKDKNVRLREGATIDALTLAHAVILDEMKTVFERDDLRQVLLREMAAEGAAGYALDLLRAGYNPVLVTDGTKVEVLADFLISHRLAASERSAEPLIVLPLATSLRRILPKLVTKLLSRPLAEPALKIWAREGGTTIEYPILLVDNELGFELIREGGKTIAVDKPSQGTGDEPG